MTVHSSEMTDQQVHDALLSWFNVRPTRSGFSTGERVRWMLFWLDELERRGLVSETVECTCSQYQEHVCGTPCNACKAQARKNEIEF